jgi:hypothetical protein
MRVLIIGGGLGGLTLTHGLRNSGIDVAVHERSHGNRALHACLPEESWRAYDQTSVPAPNVVRFRDTDLDTLTELQLSAPAEDAPPTRATCSSAPTAATPASRLSDVVVLTAMPSATRRRTRVSRAADVQTSSRALRPPLIDQVRSGLHRSVVGTRAGVTAP